MDTPTHSADCMKALAEFPAPCTCGVGDDVPVDPEDDE